MCERNHHVQNCAQAQLPEPLKQEHCKGKNGQVKSFSSDEVFLGLRMITSYRRSVALSLTIVAKSLDIVAFLTNGAMGMDD